MFETLKKKWGVSGIRFVLIICVFAIGGSLTGYLAKRIMPFMAISQTALYWAVYIAMVTVLWPFCVLVVSVLFGQFRFFWEYEKKLGRLISGKKRK